MDEHKSGKKTCVLHHKFVMPVLELGPTLMPEDIVYAVLHSEAKRNLHYINFSVHKVMDNFNLGNHNHTSSANTHISLININQ